VDRAKKYFSSLLEPTIHPNHRRFFHSVTFTIAVGYRLHGGYMWEAQAPCEQFARMAALVAGAAHLAHLARHGFTVKSSPHI
jgi:hypothetical protein